MKTLKVVFVPVGKQPEVREIPNTLEAFQAQVDGHIEAVGFVIDDIVIIVDEEGKLKSKKANLYCYGDTLVGDVLFTKGGADGDFVSLDNADVKEIIEWVELSRLALG